MFTLAHLADPHLALPPLVPPRLLLNKRIQGYLSYQLGRKKNHDGSVLAVLVEDLRRSAPDHVAVVGDLVNIALPDEFVRAAGWLDELGDSDMVSVIPGNHDAYVDIAWEQSLAHWARWMCGLQVPGDADERAIEGYDGFPFVRLRDEIALIGVSSAAPMPPGMAAGRIGDPQLERLDRWLDTLATMDVLRVILVHHPPMDGIVPSRKRLIDAPALRDVIVRRGADLVLFGHSHRLHSGELPTATGVAHVIGMPSASMRPGGHKDAAAYQLYRIDRAGSGWRIELELRQIDAHARAMAVLDRRVLTCPSMPSGTVAAC